MEIGLNLALEVNMGPWYWNVPDDELEDSFKTYLVEDKNLLEVTKDGKPRVVDKYMAALDELAKKKKVTWAYIGVNVDKFIGKCKEDEKTLLKALKHYKKFLH